MFYFPSFARKPHPTLLVSAPTEPLLPPPPPGRESPMLSAHRQRYVASIRVSVEVYGGRARVGKTLYWVCRVSWSSYFSLTNLAIGTSTFQELYGRSISQLSPNASSHAIVALQSVVLSFSHAADMHPLHESLSAHAAMQRLESWPPYCCLISQYLSF